MLVNVLVQLQLQCRYSKIATLKLCVRQVLHRHRKAINDIADKDAIFYVHLASIHPSWCIPFRRFLDQMRWQIFTAIFLVDQTCVLEKM
jgi:hypothetical protein